MQQTLAMQPLILFAAVYSLLGEIERWKGIFRAAVTNWANATVLAALNAITTTFDAGTAAIIRLYDGTIPTDGDTAVGAQVLLATLTMSATSFGAAADQSPGGRITAASITGDSSADATGTCTWGRCLTQAGGSNLGDFNVGTSATAAIFNSVAFTAGSAVNITSMVVNMAETG